MKARPSLAWRGAAVAGNAQTLLCAIACLLVWSPFSVRLFAQALTEPSELERLRTENRDLRARLQQADAKLQAAQSKLTPTPSPDELPQVTKSETTSFPGFLDQLFLRKSVFSEDILNPGSISRPAQFTYAHDRHGTDSYVIDTGIAAMFITPLPQAQIDWGAGVDYHRNSSSGAIRNLLQTGVVADSVFGDPALSSFFAQIKANVSFKDDEARNVKALTGASDLLPVERKFLKIDDPHDLGITRWRWQPFAGLGWSASTDVPAGRRNGHQVLARYGIESQFFPLYSFANWKDSLEAILNLTAWSDVSSSGVYRNRDWRGYLDLNVIYWFNGGPGLKKQKASLGFGIGYEKGGNPDSDQTDVDLLTVSLKAKF